jgi:tetratricopeptide (TPR) repeat protein
MIDAYFQRGLAYGKIKNYDAAIADYSQGIKLVPADPRLWHNRALVYVDKGLPDQAMADYDEAIRLKPDYTKAYINAAASTSRKRTMRPR